jgi:hypothetical protein
MERVETLPTVICFEVIPVWSLKALEGILDDAAPATELTAPQVAAVPTTMAIPATAKRNFRDADKVSPYDSSVPVLW